MLTMPNSKTIDKDKTAADEDRRIEINMLRLLIKKYRDKAAEIVNEGIVPTLKSSIGANN